MWLAPGPEGLAHRDDATVAIPEKAWDTSGGHSETWMELQTGREVPRREDEKGEKRASA